MTAPAKRARPRVLVNFATSVDGKINPAPGLRQGKFMMSRHREDFRRMVSLRAEADAILIGASNLRADNPDLAIPAEEHAARRARLAPSGFCCTGRDRPGRRHQRRPGNSQSTSLTGSPHERRRTMLYRIPKSTTIPATGRNITLRHHTVLECIIFAAAVLVGRAPLPEDQDESLAAHLARSTPEKWSSAGD